MDWMWNAKEEGIRDCIKLLAFEQLENLSNWKFGVTA